MNALISISDTSNDLDMPVTTLAQVRIFRVAVDTFSPRPTCMWYKLILYTH